MNDSDLVEVMARNMQLTAANHPQAGYMLEDFSMAPAEDFTMLAESALDAYRNATQDDMK